MLVMMPMMSCPPQRAPLGRTGSEHGKHELRGAAGLKRFVGKVTMIEACYGKHPDDEEGDGEHNSEGADAGEQCE